MSFFTIYDEFHSHIAKNKRKCVLLQQFEKIAIVDFCML